MDRPVQTMEQRPFGRRAPSAPGAVWYFWSCLSAAFWPRLARGHPFMIVTMAGLPGTGKSTLAQALARRLPGAVLDKDAIRAALFEPGRVEYSAAQDDFCMEIMLQAAAYLLAKDAGLHILLDGRTFSRAYQRGRAMEFCRQAGTAWAVIECVCAERTAVERLAQAVERKTHPAANRTPELYRQVREAWEPIDEPKLVIDTDENLDSCVARALGYLSSA